MTIWITFYKFKLFIFQVSRKTLLLRVLIFTRMQYLPNTRTTFTNTFKYLYTLKFTHFPLFDKSKPAHPYFYQIFNLILLKHVSYTFGKDLNQHSSIVSTTIQNPIIPTKFISPNHPHSVLSRTKSSCILMS